MGTEVKNAKLMEMMCAALEIKEKMKTLYDEAAGKCSDDVGIETFRMLHRMEQKHLDRISGIYTESRRAGLFRTVASYWDILPNRKPFFLSRNFLSFLITFC